MIIKQGGKQNKKNWWGRQTVSILIRKLFIEQRLIYFGMNYRKQIIYIYLLDIYVNVHTCLLLWRWLWLQPSLPGINEVKTSFILLILIFFFPFFPYSSCHSSFSVFLLLPILSPPCPPPPPLPSTGTVTGWGRTRERGSTSSVLREVQVSHTSQTLYVKTRSMDLTL